MVLVVHLILEGCLRNLWLGRQEHKVRPDQGRLHLRCQIFMIYWEVSQGLLLSARPNRLLGRLVHSPLVLKQTLETLPDKPDKAAHPAPEELIMPMK